MAVALKFINLIICNNAIEAWCDGGWSKVLTRHAQLLGRIVWHDDHLFRTGSKEQRSVRTITVGELAAKLAREKEAPQGQDLEGVNLLIVPLPQGICQEVLALDINAQNVY